MVNVKDTKRIISWMVLSVCIHDFNVWSVYASFLNSVIECFSFPYQRNSVCWLLILQLCIQDDFWYVITFCFLVNVLYIRHNNVRGVIIILVDNLYNSFKTQVTQIL